jgi:hypothetical protein
VPRASSVNIVYVDLRRPLRWYLVAVPEMLNLVHAGRFDGLVHKTTYHTEIALRKDTNMGYATSRGEGKRWNEKQGVECMPWPRPEMPLRCSREQRNGVDVF